MPPSDCVCSLRSLQVLQMLGHLHLPAGLGFSPPLPRCQHSYRSPLHEHPSMLQPSQRTVPSPADLTVRPVPPPQHHPPCPVPAGSLEPLLQHLLQVVQVLPVSPLLLHCYQRLVPVSQVPRSLADGHSQRQLPGSEALPAPRAPPSQTPPGEALSLLIAALREQSVHISRPNVLLVPQIQTTLQTIEDNALRLGQIDCTPSCPALRECQPSRHQQALAKDLSHTFTLKMPAMRHEMMPPLGEVAVGVAIPLVLHHLLRRSSCLSPVSAPVGPIQHNGPCPPNAEMVSQSLQNHTPLLGSRGRMRSPLTERFF
mmetsp:Transcript_30069/g.63734  ORF Transcript_30069/g.63734 Transcript_30069/m.63734 type:complete len:313 (-) Transcript_30069:219-1157(-)